MAEVITSHAAFYSITDGRICRTFKAATAKSIERVNKMGKIVHEEFMDGLSGRITEIKTKDHPDYGKFWLITLTDGNWSGVVQIKYSSGYASAFLKMLPNVDLSKDVTIVPKMTIDGDKKKASLFIMQEGVPLKHFYTKDNNNGLPQMKKIKVKGKETWDDTEMMEFLEKMVFTEVVPQLNGSGAANQSEEIADLDF
tara:strand:+ start:2064 stop:2654 length:591 start_codon:yes stop_codon:yes gene_type:complete